MNADFPPSFDEANSNVENRYHQTKQRFILCINPTIHVRMTDRKLTVNAVNMKMFDRKNMWKVNATIYCKKVNSLGFEFC
jgi:hypothetical protein